jgi:thioredoxin 1
MNKPLLSLFLLPMLYVVTHAQPLLPPEDSSQAIADRIVSSKKPVLVDFWAAWCGPCRILNPIIADLEKKYHSRVLFIKVNVDQHRALSAYFSVSSIPAVFIINNKNVVQALAGVQPKARYIAALDAVLSAPPPPPPPAADSTSAPPPAQQ